MLSGAPEGELDQLAPYCPIPKTGCCQCGGQRLTGWDCVGRNLHPSIPLVGVEGDGKE